MRWALRVGKREKVKLKPISCHTQQNFRKSLSMQDLSGTLHGVLGPKQTHTPKANNAQVAEQIPKWLESEYTGEWSHRTQQPYHTATGRSCLGECVSPAFKDLFSPHLPQSQIYAENCLIPTQLTNSITNSACLWLIGERGTVKQRNKLEFKL